MLFFNFELTIGNMKRKHQTWAVYLFKINLVNSYIIFNFSSIFIFETVSCLSTSDALKDLLLDRV